MKMDRSVLAIAMMCGTAGSVLAGDDCAAPTPVFAGVIVFGDTESATPSAGIQRSYCGRTGDPGPDVWYTYTAEVAGEHTFSLCGSTFDTVLSLWTACPDPNGGSNPLICNDDNCAEFESALSYDLAAGQTVLVRIGGYEGRVGHYLLSISGPVQPPPANDNCDGAIAISDGDSQPFDSTRATSSGVAITCTTIENDLYYTYTATCTGDVTIATCGTDFDTVLAVFDACGGNQVACDDDSCDGVTPPGSGLASTLTFPATSGTTYVVIVGAYSAFGWGQGVLSISCSGTTPTCPADFNGDGFLDFFDYDDYVVCFETDNCPEGRTADFNGDEFVDFFDYDDYVVAFEAGC